MAKDKSQEIKPIEKTAFLAELIAAAVVTLLALLDLAGIFSDKVDAMYIINPAMAVMLAGQSIRDWKKHKLYSLAFMVVAILLIVITVKKIFA
ncbi:MAG: hypothetical protein IJM38_00045 [Ruminococcus sp.]|nr:hypothetical protein [Ruminococcus sp.]